MKQCTACGIEKDETEFYKNSRWPDGLQKQCKACHKVNNKTHYSNNKSDYLKRAKIQREETTLWWQSYKQTLSCVVCGESRWWCLDFHHTDPSEKEGALSRMISSNSREAVLSEIEKCIVVCRNCHADIHHQERNVSLV